MPTATRDGVSLYYDTWGSGETVVFIEDVGFGAWLWGWQNDALAGPFETLVWDLRGTGRSDVPEGPYTVPQMANDLEAVLADHGVRNVHLVGCGLGGMVALDYAQRHNRAETLTLIGTTPGGDEAERNIDRLDDAFAPRDDEEALASSLEAVLSAAFREQHPEAVERITAWRAEDDAGREAWEAQAAAFEGYEHRDPLYETTVPTLVLHGEDDEIVPFSNAELLDRELPRSELEAAPEAGHLVGVERATGVNDAIIGFLEAHVESDQ
ncbi:alpha/beta fold hydrolase [Natranaeroarchaeum sulfidigenes]|uniref:alpha/beta fold hydrolase n=1 Tax=Natranaeroarchaeum sulfidigenes TaxID=2784880 RepID=UPI001EE5133B|nr:alpha/beta fold hydrolase [Natranaeroarchaeum sulfidigenes]